ncbi:hypothetical protein SIN8267_02688 [Sinobacterium norvegicum]|uniref:histidine kinase n=1 Tax=Sinobacterium norvegicum TaxID=1641715 RepID=A0ABM9AH63_9GAMM|nr:ATP-binding protein [Sinobacterium norvegicum]CAH0992555.1 hypothetical protein SIN8267_02688 [Sinobacterium norvegicum]
MTAPQVYPQLTNIEQLFARLTQNFLEAEFEQIIPNIEQALNELMLFSHADRLNMIRLTVDKKLEAAFMVARQGIDKPQTIKADANSVYLQHILAGKVIALDHEPVEITSKEEFDAMRMGGLTGHLVVPLEVRGEIWGAIAAARFGEHPGWDDALIQRVKSIGQFLASVYDRYKLWITTQEQQQKLALLSRHLMQSQEDERRLLARELHDNFSQRMALLSLNTGAIVDAIEHGEASLAPAQEVYHSVQQLAKDMQALSRSLHPAILEDLGLEAGLVAECRRVERLKPLTIHCFIDEIPSLNLDISLNIYRILQESLNNVLKHAPAATSILVTLAYTNQQLLFSVADDGQGIDGELSEKLGSLGLVSIAERAIQCGGAAEFLSPDDGGFEVVVTIPYVESVQ